MSLFRIARYPGLKNHMWLVAAHLDGSPQAQVVLQLPLTPLQGLAMNEQRQHSGWSLPSQPQHASEARMCLNFSLLRVSPRQHRG